MSETESNYWVDQVAAKAMAAKPEGEIIVESGHAPSGYYHIGTLREILTASAIAWRIKQAGRKARHIDFVDDMDALRKVPAGVPEEWKQYIGWPVSMVPDPTGKHESWAAWLMSDLNEALDALGVERETRYASKEYPGGMFTGAIETVLENLDKGKRIIAEVSGRELPENWSPVQILSDGKSLREWEFAGWDKGRKVVMWRDRGGAAGEVPYDAGRVLLSWRFDWPARWAILGVDVEPFGRDHATKGGSYDTGVAIMNEIFKVASPMPVPYDFINRAGETKKMSKSAGDVVTAKGALEIMPAEIVRYFILKSLPGRQLFFDQGVGLYNLIDEYAKVEQAVKAGERPDFAEAYEIASAQTKRQTISSVPFGHLVQCYQAAEREVARTMDLLARSGYGDAVRDEREVIEHELGFVANWLDGYAPDNVKFAVRHELPKVELSDEQRAFLGKLADVVEDEKDLNGQGMHDAIYAAAEESGLKGGQAFRTLYGVILGQDSGPKAGWFLAELDRGWLLKRLRLTA